jgi:tRNA modification GTPase
MIPSDTICAISTPAGTGGIAVIRVSGNAAFAICDQLYTAKNGAKLHSQPSHTVSFGTIKNLDDVLLTVFRTPHAYTGEDTVEIACHGSLYIQQELLKLLLAHGCRMATAGEFTQRAFLNGKLDLSQAEAVGDLIAASAKATHDIAMRQMRGDFSNTLTLLRDELLHFTGLVELELDFSEEDVTFADRGQLMKLATKIETTINRLTDSFSTGNAIKNGIPVAIVGETNAGKSTLLNRLLQEDKAIVSEIHGTTRDSIEDTIIIRGLLFRFIDTAGIRDTADVIEQLGVMRTFRKIEQAAIVLWVVDLSADHANSETLFHKINSADKRLILILNKADKLHSDELSAKNAFFNRIHPDSVTISAKSGAGMELLEEKLVTALPNIAEGDVVVSNVRHYDALTKALQAIRQVKQGLHDGISEDLLTGDIHECLVYLGSITGQQIQSEEVLQHIFKHFCIGK